MIPASILHDVGIEVAENEGPPEARELLFKTGFKAEDVEQICAIIGHYHSPGDVETQNIKVLYDAVYLVNMQEKLNNKNDSEQQSIIERELLTESGKKLAMENYAKQTTNAH